MSDIEIRKKELLKKLNEFIESHPQYINEFMQACLTQMTEFRAKCQIDLNKKSEMAIEMLFRAISKDEKGQTLLDVAADRQKIAMLIGGMKFHYPKGLESVWTGNKKMMDMFLDLIIKEDTINRDEFWLQHNDHYEWMQMLMKQVKDKI